MVVPFLGWLSICRRPPTSLTRSSMLMRPNPRRASGLVESKPRPLSLTLSSKPPSRAQLDRCAGRLSVPQHIGHGFLNDAIKANRDVGRNFRNILILRKQDIDSVFLMNLFATRAQCRNESRVLEHPGMEPVRQLTDFIGQIAGTGLDSLKIPANFRIFGHPAFFRLLMAIDRAAICWFTSSCNSRATRVRSTSCISISRPARSRSRSRLARAPHD